MKRTLLAQLPVKVLQAEVLTASEALVEVGSQPGRRTSSWRASASCMQIDHSTSFRQKNRPSRAAINPCRCPAATRCRSLCYDRIGLETWTLASGAGWSVIANWAGGEESERGRAGPVRRPAFRYSVLGSAEPTFGLKLLVLGCCYARVSGAFHKQIRSDSTTR